MKRIIIGNSNKIDNLKSGDLFPWLGSTALVLSVTYVGEGYIEFAILYNGEVHMCQWWQNDLSFLE